MWQTIPYRDKDAETHISFSLSYVQTRAGQLEEMLENPDNPLTRNHYALSEFHLATMRRYEALLRYASEKGVVTPYTLYRKADEKHDPLVFALSVRDAAVGRYARDLFFEDPGSGLRHRRQELAPDAKATAREMLRTYIHYIADDLIAIALQAGTTQKDAFYFQVALDAMNAMLEEIRLQGESMARLSADGEMPIAALQSYEALADKAQQAEEILHEACDGLTRYYAAFQQAAHHAISFGGETPQENMSLHIRRWSKLAREIYEYGIEPLRRVDVNDASPSGLEALLRTNRLLDSYLKEAKHMRRSLQADIEQLGPSDTGKNKKSKQSAAQEEHAAPQSGIRAWLDAIAQHLEPLLRPFRKGESATLVIGEEVYERLTEQEADAAPPRQNPRHRGRGF